MNTNILPKLVLVLATLALMISAAIADTTPQNDTDGGTMGCTGYTYACASGADQAGLEQQAAIYMLVALGLFFGFVL